MIAARWLLLILLLFDQVGSPLHDHRHDSGIDFHPLQAEHPEESLDATHRDVTDSGPLLFHAVTAIKSETDLTLRQFDHDPPRPLHRIAVTMDVPEDVDDFLRPGGRTPLRWIHRSLPPDGRAPPLHV